MNNENFIWSSRYFFVSLQKKLKKIKSMTQEQKELLLKDLCSRLPYGVIVEDRNGVHKLTPGNTEFTDLLYNGKCNIKPYLFPMSGMTEEQQKEANVFDDMDMDILSENLDRNYRNKTNIPTATYNYTDWLDRNYFDYRGLIPMGLAIDATNLNIY